MSNPTELPDLDRLEALAKQAGLNGWPFHGVAFQKAANPAAVLALIALARRPPVPALRPTDDELWNSTIRDRDTYQEWADKLAIAVAAHFGVDIGEHSNANCPWHEALEAIESADPARRAQPESGALAGEYCDHPAFLKIMDDILTPQGMAKFNADEDVNLNREFASEIFRAGLAAQSQGEPAVVEYVPIATGSRDVAGGVHPKDKTPADPACSAALDARGDDRGQGLDPYWKWGFRAGWHDRAALAAKAEAPAHETIVHQADQLVCTACGTSAQQAAAPGALDADEMMRLRRLIHALGMDGSTNACDDQVRGLLFTALGQAAGKLERATGALGTPEAPADLPRLYRFDCYMGKTKMAAGVGVHATSMEEAEQKARKLADKDETIKFESNRPCHATRKCEICAAYERAAQLDGGQGEGGKA